MDLEKFIRLADDGFVTVRHVEDRDRVYLSLNHVNQLTLSIDPVALRQLIEALQEAAALLPQRSENIGA